MMSEESWSALHHAAFGGHTDLVRELLVGGEDPAAEAGGVRGATPMNFALFYGHRETAAVLDEAGRHPDDLRTAAGLGDVDGLRRFLGSSARVLTAGADAGMAFTAPLDAFPPRSAPPDDGTTLDEALTWAARNGSVDAMEALVAHGADVNANPYRGTALLWATFADRVDAATWLLDHGADPDLAHDFGGAEHGFGATALHLAAQFGCTGCLDLLIQRGADLTITDARWNGTPADWANVGEEPEIEARLRALMR